MDTSNRKPDQGASGSVGDSSMESGDWRSQLPPDSRQKIVNRITQDLKSLLPLSGNDWLNELKKIVGKFEAKVFADATSQSDYLRKIAVKLHEMENRSQNPMSDVAMQSNSAANRVNPSDPASSDSTPGKDDSKVEDWQDEVFRKITAMKDLYLADLNDLYQQILAKLQKLDSLPQQTDNGQLEKLKEVKIFMERCMQFLQIPKHDILATHKDNLAPFEMCLVDIVNSNRQKPAAQQQQPLAHPPPHMHSDGSLQQNVPSGPQQGGSGTSGSFVESGNWKAQLTAYSRQMIVDKITGTVKAHLQCYGLKGIPELEKIAEMFEEEVYAAATSQHEYLKKIAVKMMDLEIHKH